MSISAQIIADSINSRGCRLTTYVLEYPRFIHSEMLTHRVFSKNAASSRAIPIEKMIQQVIDNPAMPVWWGKNQSGMQAKEELDNTEKKYRRVIEKSTDLEEAKYQWLLARDKAITSVRELNTLGLHKQIANRLLEPWFNIRVILSGTEFDNFFKLRAHPDAQPEFQALAYKMLDLYQTNKPTELKIGQWHIPFGDKISRDRLCSFVDDSKGQCHDEKDIIAINNEIQKLALKVAVARCARVSYFNYEGKDDYEADIKLCDRLFQNDPKHLSPTEHVARCLHNDNFYANFRGFKQYRKFVEDAS